MRILGIDPGIALMGYGLIEVKGNSFEMLEYGVLKTSKDTPTTERLS